MKTEIKALPLSLALSFLALLGACSSVNSTPNSELPNGENSVILDNAEQGAETVEGLSPDSTTSEPTDEMADPTATDTEATDTMSEDTATDEMADPTASDTEATDTMSEDTATDEMADPTASDTEATDSETAEEVNPTEIILPESDSAEVETDSEAAETMPETMPEIMPETMPGQ